MSRLSWAAVMLGMAGGGAYGLTASQYEYVRTTTLNDIVTRATSIGEAGWHQDDTNNPTVFNLTTPSGDGVGLKIQTTGSQKTKMRPPSMSVGDMSFLFTFLPGDGMAGTSNYNLLEIRSSVRLNVFGVSSGGTMTVGFNDQTGAGAIEAVSFGVPTNQWAEWFVVVSGNNLKIYDVSGSGPFGAGNLLVNSTTTLGGGSTNFLTVGDESSSGGKNSDFTYDEVYIEKSVVAIETLVPEPATAGLILLGLPLVLRRRR